jgi:hypothetical protein
VSPRPLPPLPDLPPEAFTEEYNDAYVEKYAYDEYGADRGLIWENLQRGPEERLAHLERFIAATLEVRDGGKPGEASTSFSEILRHLLDADVDFVVVGAVAANLRGIDLSTSDLAIVFRQTDENRRKLAKLLESIDAQYFDPAGRTIRPTAERLRDLRLNLLRTRLGRLDAFARIAETWDYDEIVARHSSPLAFHGRELRVLTLEGLIRAKEIAGRPKDQNALGLLRAAVELERRRLE